MDKETKMIELSLYLMNKLTQLYPLQTQSIYKFPKMPQLLEAVWTVLESQQIQGFWSKTLKEITVRVENMMRRANEGGEGIDSQQITELSKIDIMPSFYLIKLIFN